jgi:repressor of nif and glnA expression
MVTCVLLNSEVDHVHKPSDTPDDEHLATLIRLIQAGHRGYGAPRIAAGLRRRGLSIDRKSVERVMRERGLSGITRRLRRSLTKQDTKAAPART